MKTYTELLRGVKDFADENLGKKFVITKGRFEGETVTVAGYTKQDLYDRIILDADPMQSYWHVGIEDLEEC